MPLMNWLTYFYLSLLNCYIAGTPEIGAHEEGVWRYKTKWNVRTSDWEPMGGQGGNSFLIKRTTKRPAGKLRKFRIHALKKMSGLYPCSDDERKRLWEIWNNRKLLASIKHK